MHRTTDRYVWEAGQVPPPAALQALQEDVDGNPTWVLVVNVHLIDQMGWDAFEAEYVPLRIIKRGNLFFMHRDGPSASQNGHAPGIEITSCEISKAAN